MKIVCLTEKLSSYDGSTEEIRTRIIEIDKPLEEVIKRARHEIIEQIRYTMDSEDEDDLNAVIDELHPILPSKDRLWGKLFDPDYDLRMTVTIIE